MKKKALALILSLIMGASVLAGCGGSGAAQSAAPAQEEKKEEASAENEKTDGIKIGYSAGSLGDEYLKETGAFLKADCEANGCEYTEMSADGSSATQAMQIENLTTMGCDAICICPIDPKAIEGAVKAAKEAGVKVIYCGNPSDFDDQEAFDAAINCDQYDYGYKAAQAASEWIDANYPDAADGSVEVAIYYNSSHPLFQERGRGFDAIEELNSKAKVVQTFDMIGQDNPAAKAQEYADTMFVSHPDIKVVLAFSSVIGTSIDEVAMRTNGVDPSKFAIFSSDWLAAAADSIIKSENNESTFRGLIACADLGHAFYDVALGLSEPDESGFYALPLTTVTVENVQDEIKLHQ